MEVTTAAIKALRDRTGIGIMDCKRALEAAGGDPDKAERTLMDLGVASAAKKASRETKEGLIEAYIHSGSRIGAIVEVSCETDFVARTSDFKGLSHDLAMQVAAMSPRYVDSSEIPEGSEDTDPQEACLMQQPFIRDPAITIEDLVNQAIGKLGENVRVRRFTRFSLGE